MFLINFPNQSSTSIWAEGKSTKQKPIWMKLNFCLFYFYSFWRRNVRQYTNYDHICISFVSAKCWSNQTEEIKIKKNAKNRWKTNLHEKEELIERFEFINCLGSSFIIIRIAVLFCFRSSAGSYNKICIEWFHATFFHTIHTQLKWAYFGLNENQQQQNMLTKAKEQISDFSESCKTRKK